MGVFEMPAHLTPAEHDLVYNFTSFGLASMGASTFFFFFRLSSFAEKYRAALCFTGFVTLIAMYHYFRIFNSFVEAYTPCYVMLTSTGGRRPANPSTTPTATLTGSSPYPSSSLRLSLSWASPRPRPWNAALRSASPRHS